LNLKKLKVHWQ